MMGRGAKALQIALCDDEEVYHEKIKELIKQYKQLHSDRTLSLSFFLPEENL